MKHFDQVHILASDGGELYGAPDYLARDRQLEIALDHIANLHEEIGRLHKAADRASAAAQDAIDAATAVVEHRGSDILARRRESARARRRSGNLTWLEYFRTRAWIELKSRRVDQASRLAATRRSLPNIVSRYVGDAPIRRLMATREYEQAYVLARALLSRHGDNPRFLALVRDIQAKRGALSSVLAITRQIEKHTHTSRLAARQIEGRLREISGWYPKLPGASTPVVPADGSIILHLVKESRPYHSNGFTSRSHRNFLAEKAAGLRPVVVTELGFPRRDGVEDFPVVDHIDGVEHWRLDQGPASAADVPADIWLQDFAQAAQEVLRKIRPAVIHASSGRRGYETALVGMALAEKANLPFVYEVRSFFESTWTGDTRWEETGEIFARRLAVEQMCMERADIIITLGEAMRDELIRRGAPASKIRLVPNGVDLEAFPRMKRPKDLAQQFGINNSPTYGYVSNFDHYRESQETLVHAAATLKARGIDAFCVLVGDGGRRRSIEDLASQLEVDDRVVFTGAVDHNEIARYYGLIDVFVVPRVDERAARYVTPLKPFEAMALGKPVVVSDLPALREIVAPPNRGTVFPSGNAHALATVLEQLLGNPERISEMGERAAAWVSESRQWQMNGERYSRIFAEARREHQAKG